MRYEERVIEEVQSANDIVEIISQYIPVKRAGRSFKACCPFHSEKTPSFMIHQEKQIFHCFGCGAGGNVFGFLMKHENMSFPEALRLLAERAGIRLPESENVRQDNDYDKLYEIYQLAADYYHQNLMEPQAGKIARDYFVKRGFDGALAKEFTMGWATDSWRGLHDFFLKKNIPESLLLKSGLIYRSPKGPFYDAFRSRLLFPIRNLQGKVVAFGGRLIQGEEGPKYLNSPENPIFQKRRELFGLYLAKKHIDPDKPQILVLEGYFGFMRLYQAGFKNTVATLGTSLTPDHVRVILRFAQEAIVIYDGDKAGESAALRGLEVFLEQGMSVRLVRMPQGLDPDDYIVKNGAESFRHLVETAQDFFDYKLEILMRRFNVRDSLGLMKITSDFLETFSKIENPVLLDRYLRKLAGTLGVDENSLKTELQKLKKKTEKKASIEPPPSVKTQTTPAYPKTSSPEILLLALAIEEKDLKAALLADFNENDFEALEYKELFRLISNADSSANLALLLNRLDSDSLKQQLIAVTAYDWTTEDKNRAFRDCQKVLAQRKVNGRLDELRRSIAKAESEGAADQLKRYVEEYQALWKEKV